ncbi:hypothetical protein HK099_004373 [Clydaea vesicula]|uniref:Uncharacterized protein n=1 Tax=Clydaea vesicula TaxID=447962 RepID=A0AAD5U201_9FUNG|nr:hypothetical protein HK099_004373 [Clydaea vesicula]
MFRKTKKVCSKKKKKRSSGNRRSRIKDKSSKIKESNTELAQFLEEHSLTLSIKGRTGDRTVYDVYIYLKDAELFGVRTSHIHIIVKYNIIQNKTNRGMKIQVKGCITSSTVTLRIREDGERSVRDATRPECVPFNEQLDIAHFQEQVDVGKTTHIFWENVETFLAMIQNESESLLLNFKQRIE